MKAQCLLILVAMLCCVGLAQAQSVEFDPSGGLAVLRPASVYVAPDGVSGQRVPVQMHLDVPPLTEAQECKVREYLAKYAPKLSAENLAATANGLRLLVGIRQTHIPLTRRPVEILSDYQLITQLLEYLRMWIVLPPVERFYLNPLPELGYVEKAEHLSLPCGNVQFARVSRELCQPKQPKETPCSISEMFALGLLPPGSVSGGENSVVVQGETIDLTPIALLWLWKQWQNDRGCHCEKPHDGTCPPGEPINGPGGGNLNNPAAPGTVRPPGELGTFTGVPSSYSNGGNIASGNPTGPGGATVNFGRVPPVPGFQAGSQPGLSGPPATPIGKGMK